MAKRKSSLKGSKLLWEKADNDNKFAKQHVLVVDIAGRTITIRAMDDGNNRVRIRGDLGMLGGLNGVSVQDADEFIESKLIELTDEGDDS